MEETKKCPYCGEEVLAVAKKCKHCGEWFSNAENETVHKPQIECPVCAELVEVDTEICPHCHERISGAAPISPSVVSPQKKKMILEGQTNGFFEYYFADVFVHHYADFKGKISRKQFWFGYLCLMLLYLPVSCLDVLIGLPYILTGIVLLAMLVPSTAFMVRRLHDVGKSGWWILVGLVPLVGFIVLLVLLCKKGETRAIPVKHGLKDYVIWIAGVALALITAVDAPSQVNEKDIANELEHIISEESSEEDSVCMTTDADNDETARQIIITLYNDYLFGEKEDINGFIDTHCTTEVKAGLQQAYTEAQFEGEGYAFWLFYSGGGEGDLDRLCGVESIGNGCYKVQLIYGSVEVTKIIGFAVEDNQLKIALLQDVE